MADPRAAPCDLEHKHDPALQPYNLIGNGVKRLTMTGNKDRCSLLHAASDRSHHMLFRQVIQGGGRLIQQHERSAPIERPGERE